MTRRTMQEQHLAARDKLRKEPDMEMVWTEDLTTVRGDIRHCGLSEAGTAQGFTNVRTHFRFTTGRWEWSGTKDGRRYYGVIAESDVKVLRRFDSTGRRPKLPHTFTLTDVRSEIPAYGRRSEASKQRQRNYEKGLRNGEITPDPYKGKAAAQHFGRFDILH